MLAELPVVTVHIPPALRALVDGRDEVTASGETVAEVLEAVIREYPAIESRLYCRDGFMPPGLAVYLGGRSVRDLAGLQTPVDSEELVSLVAIGNG